MRNLEDIENELSAAREALSSVEGTPTEVYSRIVGYYRSVRNWNRGKRQEYAERRLYRVDTDGQEPAGVDAPAEKESPETRLLLFVQASCPGCSPAKAAAGRLGIPVNLVNADTSDGMAEAVRRNVMSTPTAILLSPGGKELRRARDAEAIGAMLAAEPA